MPILKETRIEDAVTFRATGHIEIREARIILRDDVEIARSYHRRVVVPGEPTNTESEPTKALAKLWTQDQIDAAKAVPDFARAHAEPPTAEGG